MDKKDFLIGLFVGTAILVATVEDFFSRKISIKRKKSGTHKPD
ncbi:MAG: hypothetical protein ACLQBD_21095 [Syntrophobacteraceae bacterium]|jgi:hypothetical protein